MDDGEDEVEGDAILVRSLERSMPLKLGDWGSLITPKANLSQGTRGAETLSRVNRIDSAAINALC